MSRRVSFVLTSLAMCCVGILAYLLSTPRETSRKTSSIVPPTQTTLSPPTHAGNAHMQSPTSKGTMPQLDGLRVLFIVNVMLFHCDAENEWNLEMHSLRPIWLRNFGDGMVQPSLGFFMVLSGFLRVITLKSNFDDAPAFRHHVARCLARFCPAYYLALALTFAFAYYLDIDSDPKEQLLMAYPIQALFLQSFFPITVCTSAEAADPIYLPYAALYQGWFVATIVVCVILFPLLYQLCRYGEGCCAPVLQMMVAITLSAYWQSNASSWFDRDFVATRLLEFFAGMLSAKVAQQLPGWVSEWSAGRAWGWLFDCLILIIAVASMASMNHGNTYDEPRQKFIMGMTLIDASWCLIMVCSYQAMINGKSHGLLIIVLGCAPLTSLAQYSFGAYIYQHLLRTENVNLQWLTVALVWVMAAVSEKLMEGPIRQSMEARIKGSPPEKIMDSPQPTVMSSEGGCCSLES